MDSSWVSKKACDRWIGNENGNRLYLVGRGRNLPDGEDRRGRERLRSLAAWVRLGRAIQPTESRPEQNPKGSRKDYFRSFFFRWNKLG